MKQRVVLEYDLPSGWLQPFFTALRRGIVLGWACDACGRVSFPPERVCSCGATEGAWVSLSGEAAVEVRTEGTDGAFGLVRFDGADTRTTVRLDGFHADDQRGALQPSEDNPPAIVIAPLAEETAG